MDSNSTDTERPDGMAARCPAPRKPWVAPTLASHESLTTLTQAQYPQGFELDSINGEPQRAIPCSQGFCP